MLFLMTVRLCRHLYLTVLEVANTSLMLLSKMPSEPAKCNHIVLDRFIFLLFPADVWLAPKTPAFGAYHTSVSHSEVFSALSSGSRKPTQSHFRSNSIVGGISSKKQQQVKW